MNNYQCNQSIIFTNINEFQRILPQSSKHYRFRSGKTFIRCLRLSDKHGLGLALYAVQASKDFSHLNFKGNFISIKLFAECFGNNRCGIEPAPNPTFPQWVCKIKEGQLPLVSCQSVGYVKTSL